MANKRKAPARRSAGAGRKRVAFEGLTVGDIVNKPVQAARLDMKGDRVAGLLLKEGGVVLVVDKAKQLTGVVSEHDLLLVASGNVSGEAAMPSRAVEPGYPCAVLHPKAEQIAW